MKYRFLFLLLWVAFSAFSQQRDDSYLAFDYFYGSILEHNDNVSSLIREHPSGFTLSYNVRTRGEQRWQQEYNYPDWGVTFLYEDFNYDVLGENYSVGFHYNFYFFNRQLQFRLGQGLNYNTSPFDTEDNFKNVAFGSHITGFSQIGLQYVRPRVIGKFGLRAGILLLHHSNGGIKAPNTGTNVFSTSIGVTYDLNDEVTPNKEKVDFEPFSEPIRYNFVLRGGYNESDVINLGAEPFYVITAFLDKRISYKNTLQLGVDYLASQAVRKENEFMAVAFPSRNIDPDTDFRRIGLFAGHEFRLGKVAIPFHLGYYLYNPSDFGDPTYLRAGVKYYITDKWYGAGTVRSHGFNAETIEFGLGIRL